MNPLYLAQTNLEVDVNNTGTLCSNNGEVKIYWLNNKRSFISVAEYEAIGRDARIYLKADFKAKNFID